MPNIYSPVVTPSAPTRITVGVASTALVSANYGRKGLVIVNLGTTMSLAFDTAAVMNNGITLSHAGVWTMDEYNFTLGAVNGIAVNSGDVAIQEFTT